MKVQKEALHAHRLRSCPRRCHNGRLAKLRPTSALLCALDLRGLDELDRIAECITNGTTKQAAAKRAEAGYAVFVRDLDGPRPSRVELETRNPFLLGAGLHRPGSRRSGRLDRVVHLEPELCAC